MELSTWLIAATSLLLGCWIQTAMGFGMAVFAAPIIVFVAPEWVPIPLTATALVLSVFNTVNQRQHLQLNELVTPFLWRIPGTLFGAWLLLQMNHLWLQLSVAICVLSAVVISALGKQFSYTPKRLGIAAFVSGIMGTTTSVGGPPMALVMQHGNPATVRANLSLYFGYSCTLSMLMYGYMGLLTEEIIKASLSFLPLAVLGFLLGIRARSYVDSGKFRPLLLWLCGTAGLIALISPMMSLLK